MLLETIQKELFHIRRTIKKSQIPLLMLLPSKESCAATMKTAFQKRTEGSSAQITTLLNTKTSQGRDNPTMGARKQSVIYATATSVTLRKAMLLVMRLMTNAITMYVLLATKAMVFQKVSQWVKLAARYMHSSTRKIARVEVQKTHKEQHFAVIFASKT